MKEPALAHPGVAPEIAGMLGRDARAGDDSPAPAIRPRCSRAVLPEIEIDLGDDGQVTGAHLAVNDESHQVIEDFMLAANEAVASNSDRKRNRLPSPGASRPRAVQARRSSPSSCAASA